MRLQLLLLILAPFCSSATTEKDLELDIVFLIDGSQAAKSNLNIFSDFIQNLMDGFVVGSSSARVGLIVVNANKDDQSPPVATFKDIKSKAALKATLDTLDNYVTFYEPGQCLDYNLKVVTSYNFAGPYSGYRGAIDNHLLVYITSSTEFDTDPNMRARDIIEERMYGIVTVAYGDGVDTKILKEISEGPACSFIATNATQLNSRIRYIQQLITKADRNGGSYCRSRAPQ